MNLENAGPAHPAEPVTTIEALPTTNPPRSLAPVRPLPTIAPLPLAELLHLGATDHPDTRLVFRSPVGTLTTDLGSLYERAVRVAGGLAARGIGPADVVALQLTSRVESAIAHAAVLLRGAVLLPIVPIYGIREVAFILRQSGASAIILPGQRAAEIAELRGAPDGLPALRHIVTVADSTAAPAGTGTAPAGTAPAGTVPWQELALAPPLAPCTRPLDEVAVLVYTSGTTAAPKGVTHTHRSVAAEVASLRSLRAGQPDFGYLDLFPPGHIAGLSVLLRTLVDGLPTVFLERFDAAEAIELVHAHGVTASAGVPFHLTALLDAAQRDGRGLGPLRDFLVGGASVSPALVERAERAGLSAYRAYGSSEHPTISSGSAADPLDRRAATDGRVLPGSEVRILDPAGHDLGPGEEGEIVTRGPEQFAGYRDPALNATAFTADGWLRTGDIGRVDTKGYLTITDRIKDIIVRNGENVSSKEVEDLLMTHPAVAEAAAVAEPDDRTGERVCVFVLPRPGSALDLDEVRAHFAAAGAAKQKTPERLVIVTDLPRTAAGKVRKHELRADLHAGGAHHRAGPGEPAGG
ncbi:class I adenylate-forming enzyme family protein [Frankia sp. ACN1ag]|uniref:class I adenylate-forming enzyme family protein n=1 Tax=Frankia sp. ACN1ag TaxID=102891 RepID=UPI000A9331A0|nr:AMP-binding protein [Frankia sp. ACN1ag]